MKFLHLIAFTFIIAISNNYSQCLDNESITTTSSMQTMSNGSTINLTSSTIAQSNRLSYGGINGYWIGEGSQNVDESILFALSEPTSDLQICVTAHTCVSSACEHFKLNINGSPHTFDPNNLTVNQNQCLIVDDGTSVSGPPDGPDDCQFCYTVNLASGINDFEIIHDITFGNPNGSIYDPVIGLDCQIMQEPIPTLSQWGVIALGMLTMIFGIVSLKYTTRFRLQAR